MAPCWLARARQHTPTTLLRRPSPIVLEDAQDLGQAADAAACDHEPANDHRQRGHQRVGSSRGSGSPCCCCCCCHADGAAAPWTRLHPALCKLACLPVGSSCPCYACSCGVDAPLPALLLPLSSGRGCPIQTSVQFKSTAFPDIVTARPRPARKGRASSLKEPRRHASLAVAFDMIRTLWAAECPSSPSLELRVLNGQAKAQRRPERARARSASRKKLHISTRAEKVRDDLALLPGASVLLAPLWVLANALQAAAPRNHSSAPGYKIGK